MPNPQTFELPWAPSVNSYLQPMRNGRGKYITAKGKQFRAAVCRIEGLPQNLQGRLAVTIWACPPDRRSRDLDNHLKSLLDAMEHAGVYENDSQIDSLSIHRVGVEQDGRMIVRIEELT